MVFLLETDLLIVRADEGGTYARLVRTGRLDLILTILFFPMEGFDMRIQGHKWFQPIVGKVADHFA